MNLKQIVNKIKARFKTKVPTGMTEFDTWSSSIILTYEFPDNDSTRFALATMILHADSKLAYASKHFFAKQIIKAMANQVAAGVMQDLKAKQALEQQKQAEATAAPSLAVVSNGPQQ
jgi:hypothetical protein